MQLWTQMQWWWPIFLISFVLVFEEISHLLTHDSLHAWQELSNKWGVWPHLLLKTNTVTVFNTTSLFCDFVFTLMNFLSFLDSWCLVASKVDKIIAWLQKRFVPMNQVFNLIFFLRWTMIVSDFTFLPHLLWLIVANWKLLTTQSSTHQYI